MKRGTISVPFLNMAQVVPGYSSGERTSNGFFMADDEGFFFWHDLPEPKRGEIIRQFGEALRR